MRSLRLLCSNSSRTYERTGRFATGSSGFGTSCIQKTIADCRNLLEKKNGGEIQGGDYSRDHLFMGEIEREKKKGNANLNSDRAKAKQAERGMEPWRREG